MNNVESEAHFECNQLNIEPNEVDVLFLKKFMWMACWIEDSDNFKTMFNCGALFE